MENHHRPKFILGAILRTKDDSNPQNKTSFRTSNLPLYPLPKPENAKFNIVTGIDFVYCFKLQNREFLLQKVLERLEVGVVLVLFLG